MMEEPLPKEANGAQEDNSTSMGKRLSITPTSASVSLPFPYS
jgi:hypothetical protein